MLNYKINAFLGNDFAGQWQVGMGTETRYLIGLGAKL